MPPVEGSTEVSGLHAPKLWERETASLLCIAYPVVNGIPQLAPENGRVMSTPVPGANADEIPAQPS